eukprot:CAMPEP_0118938348 /NCGR_PEP_ID=MMETSP1169-20130426/25551_1 /TAXON_ID=36882 /ORGANISM="Pyramimonas obovata, Strain CCMP722" /LENGTH=59 /DNA_ID=CAMNT_0006882247 /DNA_START=419 /DNA_END=595 /DNA_ORIENTATION=+
MYKPKRPHVLPMIPKPCSIGTHSRTASVAAAPAAVPGVQPDRSPLPPLSEEAALDAQPG